MIRKLFDWKPDLMDDLNQNKIFLIGTYTVLGLVSTVMTIMNILTDKGFLTVCTAIFAFLCVFNIVLSMLGNTYRSIAKVLFAVEVLCMFTFFLVSGNPEGFSAIWICMLPSLGMFFFNRYKGTVLCAAMFAILVFFLWTPVGQGFLMFPYSDSFRMRFPVLFVAFHLFAYFLETLRDSAYKETRRMRNYYHDLSLRDPLTEVYNRQGMYSALEEEPEYKNAERLGVAIFDIDFFKAVNDTYGHNTGDDVLKSIAAVMNAALPAIVCRWGGEEFVAVFADGSVTVDALENIRTQIEAMEFRANEYTFHITVSVGLYVSSSPNLRQIDSLIANADMALYHAKDKGRNQLIEYTDSMQMVSAKSASV